MTEPTDFLAQGVIPACLLPFNEDLTIDEASLRKHLDDVAAVPGVTALTVNGHSSEVSSCTFEEQQRVLEIAVDQLRGRLPIVSGIYTESALEAMRRYLRARRPSCSGVRSEEEGDAVSIGALYAQFRRLPHSSAIGMVTMTTPSLGEGLA